MEENNSDGVLVLKVISNGAINSKMDIGYLAENASWQAFYEIKGNKINEPLDVTLKAKVKQNTGLDWKGVKLSLINSEASRNNTAPVLRPWFLNSYNNNEVRSNAKKDSTEMTKEKFIEEVVVTGYRFRSTENQLNISFDVDVPYDVLSNDEEHFITIKQYKIPAEYKYFSAPKYDNEAFLIAKIKDFNKYNFIPGLANIIFENMYVGETTINPNQTTEELNVTLGDDKKISIQKEVVDDKASLKFFSSYQAYIQVINATGEK